MLCVDAGKPAWSSVASESCGLWWEQKGRPRRVVTGASELLSISPGRDLVQNSCGQDPYGAVRVRFFFGVSLLQLLLLHTIWSRGSCSTPGATEELQVQDSGEFGLRKK